ncbi:MAG: GNAT family N-acetyltransferase [Nitrososphaera sp.]
MTKIAIQHRGKNLLIPIKIRKATKRDIPKIFPLFKEVVRENEKKRILLKKGGLEPFAHELINFAFKRSDLIYVAERKGEIVGYLFLYVDAAIRSIKRGWVFNLGVKEEYRNQGIGKSLMRKAIKFSKDRRASTVEFLVKKENKAAIKFYKDLGFEITFHKMARDI